MGPLEIIGGILLILTSIVIVIAVTLQQPKGNGLGTISGGGSEQYLSKGKSRTLESTLAKATKYSAIVLFIITVAVSAVIAYLK